MRNISFTSLRQVSLREPALLQKAQQAIARILAEKSERRELWEESDKRQNWQASMARPQAIVST